MPKLCLESEQTMETNTSTHPRAVQKTWTIRNRYGNRYANTCIPLSVSLSNGRRLTGLRDLRPWLENRGYTYGGGGVRIARPWRAGAVVRRRGAGRPATARRTIRVAGVLRLWLPTGSSPASKGNIIWSHEISAAPPLEGEVTKPAKDKQRHDGRQPQMHTKSHS